MGMWDGNERMFTVNACPQSRFCPSLTSVNTQPKYEKCGRVTHRNAGGINMHASFPSEEDAEEEEAEEQDEQEREDEDDEDEDEEEEEAEDEEEAVVAC